MSTSTARINILLALQDRASAGLSRFGGSLGGLAKSAGIATAALGAVGLAVAAAGAAFAIFERFMERMQGGNTETAQRFARMTESLTRLADAVINALMPVIIPLIDVISGIAIVMADWIEANRRVVTSVVEIAKQIPDAFATVGRVIDRFVDGLRAQINPILKGIEDVARLVGKDLDIQIKRTDLEGTFRGWGEAAIEWGTSTVSALIKVNPPLKSLAANADKAAESMDRLLGQGPGGNVGFEQARAILEQRRLQAIMDSFRAPVDSLTESLIALGEDALADAYTRGLITAAEAAGILTSQTDTLKESVMGVTDSLRDMAQEAQRTFQRAAAVAGSNLPANLIAAYANLGPPGTGGGMPNIPRYNQATGEIIRPNATGNVFIDGREAGKVIWEHADVLGGQQALEQG